MNWVLFFSMYCQVPCLSTSIHCFQPRAMLCNWASRQTSQTFFFNVTNLCFDCRLLNVECVLFSDTVSRKDFSKTFLTLVWILIERPYKWRHKFQVDLTAFKARNLRTCFLPAVKWRAIRLVWNKILCCLLENNRFVLSSTLTFGYAIVRFFFWKKLVNLKKRW